MLRQVTAFVATILLSTAAVIIPAPTEAQTATAASRSHRASRAAARSRRVAAHTVHYRRARRDSAITITGSGFALTSSALRSTRRSANRYTVAELNNGYRAGFVRGVNEALRGRALTGMGRANTDLTAAHNSGLTAGYTYGRYLAANRAAEANAAAANAAAAGAVQAAAAPQAVAGAPAGVAASPAPEPQPISPIPGNLFYVPETGSYMFVPASGANYTFLPWTGANVFFVPRGGTVTQAPNVLGR